MDRYGNAENMARREGWLNSVYDLGQCCGWTCTKETAWIVAVICMCLFICQANTKTFSFGKHSCIRRSTFTRPFAGTNDILPQSAAVIKVRYIIVPEKVCETIVWIGILTLLQQIREKNLYRYI